MSATASCGGCGADAHLAFEAQDLNRRTTDARFSYYGCARCGLVFLDPIPASLDAYYPPEYRGRLPSVDELEGAASINEGYKVQLVRQFAQGSRLLDVGASLGGFAYLAKLSGYEVEAVERDPVCCEYMTRTLGIAVQQTDDARSVLASGRTFDAITLWHVLEHLPNPFEVVTAAAAALRPGGILVVATPNPDALQFTIFRGRWAHVDAPRHVALIPADLVEQRAGLQVLLRTTTDAGGLTWNRFGWRESIGNLTARPRVQSLLAQVGTLAGAIARPLERADFRGAAYTLVLGRRA